MRVGRSLVSRPLSSQTNFMTPHATQCASVCEREKEKEKREREKERERENDIRPC